MATVSARLRWEPIDGGDSYQLMVFDRTSAETIVNETVAGVEHTIAIPSDRTRHDLSMRVRGRHGDRWGEWTEFRPLPLELTLGERREALPPLSPEDEPGLLLVFTIDTECSVLRQPNPNPERVVDELIFGDFGDGRREGGIALHMDLLEHFGFRGSFFVDVLMELEHGQAALERVVEAILERGHEVELHLHPEHVLWSRDGSVEALAEEMRGGAIMRDRDVFRRVLELSIELFERRVGRPPIAYRAGGYRIADFHFPVLEELGIRIDSSIQPYFNSQVSDWLRVRTQPFRIGELLESPPSYFVLDEEPARWETRAFAPNPYLGDPVLAMAAEPGAPPHVLTFVSHSFQLLRQYDSDAPEEIDAFVRRFRASVPADLADRLLPKRPRAIRAFGEEVDEALVAAVAGTLRRVADRPDARCATYADLTAIGDRFWPDERHPAADPVPILNRREGTARIGAVRVLDAGLLSRLADGCSAAERPVDGEESGWIGGCENGDAAGLHERLSARAGELSEEEALRVRLRTLGIAPAPVRGALPPLAEVLFPAAAIEAVAGELGAEPWHGLPWDGATFRAWLEARSFEVVASRALPRPPEELAALEPFAAKLSWVDRSELRTEAVELELRRSAPRPPAPGAVDPAALPTAAAALYEDMHPGEERRLTIAAGSSPASPTTRILALMRAGLEVVGREGDDYTLVRPLDLADIRHFAGLAD